MELFVRLCAAAPYIARILTENPGMVDELIDSLLMDRLPSANRLDAHSIELCRGAADIDLILHSFKNSAQLTIGVRDILGREPIESLHRALADTAEACVRRTIEHEQESLAVKYGDPMISAGAMSGPGEADELITLALGKLGGREPNYHSDLEVVFLYSGDGETQRRVGGHRSIMTHQRFFNQLARAVVTRINHVGAGGRLYHLDSRLRTMGEEGRLAITVDEFLKQFSHGAAPLWQRLAICKARAISGSASRRSWVNREISRLIRETPWHAGMIREIRELRQRMEQTASPDNLKRGHGGTVDVELIAQTLMLRHAGESPKIIVPGTTECLAALSKAGHLDEKQSLELIHGYRVLRRIESNLRLMNTDERHELPEDQESLSNLAYLMNEADPELIIAQCKQAQKNNRRLFEQLLESE